MEGKSFVILYTRQTKKKHKVWHDGTLKFTTNNKGLLYDEKGTKLDSVFIKDNIQTGDQLESDHYLITIEDVLSSSVQKTNDHTNPASTLPCTKTIPRVQPLHMQGNNSTKPIIGGNCLRQNRIGLKRQRKGGFIPPLLNSSVQVDNQKEIPSFISQRINDALKSKNQNSNPNFSRWGSVMSRPKVSSDIPASLHCENTKVNQSERDYSTRSFPDDGCTDIGRKSPRNSGDVQKIIYELRESTAQHPWANRLTMNKAEIVNMPESETGFHKESCFDHKERSTDSITEGRIETRCERIENNIQNSSWDPEIHQSNFYRLKATVPFRSDGNISNINEGFITNFSEVRSSYEKQEDICEVNPLLTGKNKRTASQVLALLKPSMNEITKNREQEKSERKLPDFVDSLSSECTSKYLEEPNEHLNDTRRNDVEKYEEANFSDKGFKTNQNNVHSGSLSEERDKKVRSSQNAEKDSDFLQNRLKVSGTTEIKSLCNILDQSSLDIDLSSDFNFEMENDGAFSGIGQPSPAECIKKKDIFAIKYFKNVTNIKEMNEPLLPDKNGKSSNKDISEKSLFAATTTMSPIHLTMDSPQDECTLSNITKTSQNKNSQEVDLFCVESDSNAEDKDFNPKRNNFIKEDNPASFDIGNRTVTKRFLELNIGNTFQRDVTLSRDVIPSPPLSNIPICKNEMSVASAGDDSSIQTLRSVDENFKESPRKRLFVFSTLEEPQPKRLKIEANKKITVSAIQRDKLFTTENERNSNIPISEKSLENVELAKEKLSNPENVLIKEVSENVHIEKVQENMSVEEISEYTIDYEVLDNVVVKEVPIHKEEMLETVYAEKVVFPDKKLPEYTFDTEVPKSSLAEKFSENILVEKLPENAPIEEVQENADFEKISDQTFIKKLAEMKKNILVKEVSENATIEAMFENLPVEEVQENIPVDEEQDNPFLEEVPENIPVEERLGTAFAKKGSESAFAEKMSENIPVEEGPGTAFAGEETENILVENRAGIAFAEEEPGTTFAEEMSENISIEEEQGTTFAEEEPGTTFAKKEQGITFAEEMSENAVPEEMSENDTIKEGSGTTLDEEGPGTTFAEEGSENVFVEEMSENNPIDEEPGTARELPETIPVEEMSELKESVPVKVTENVTIEEMPENMSEIDLVEEMSELVQPQTNRSESDTFVNTVVLNNTYKPATKISSKLTNMDISGFPQNSTQKNVPKFSFKSLSANNIKKSNCNPAKDNIMKEKKPQNIIDSQINETENSCNLFTKTVGKSSLLDPVVPPNIESNVHDCWDSSPSDDGLNFDLSFDFDDNIQQSNNNKQTDLHQNAPSDNLLIKNTESCFLDYQVNKNPIRNIVNESEIAKYCTMISTDDSSIDSSRILNEPTISSSSYDKALILKNLKEKNECSDVKSHLIPTCGAETKTVSVSSDQHLKAETDLIFDTRLSNDKEIIHEFDQNESLSNNPSVKKDESIVSNHCKSYQNNLCESQIKQVDLSELKNNSQGFESHIFNIDNETNIDHESHRHNNFYSSLDELTFSPDPFDQFESGLDQRLYEEKMVPSIRSETSKPLGLRNILDSSVEALEMNPISCEKIGSTGKTDIKEVSFTPTLQSKEIHEELEEQISDETCNSISLFEKPVLHKIGQIYSLIPDGNISEEIHRNVPQHTDFRPPQRLIQQRKPARVPQGEISQVPLPCPSQMEVNVGMPGMEAQKKSLVSRAGDLNGYRMHGSVFSHIVKRTKASNNLQLNDLDFQKDNWYSECYPNSTGTVSPQEETNTSSRGAFRTDFNCRVPKRTEISPRIKNQDEDFYNVQDNATYYDFDPIVHSHNDVMCSLNNEVDMPIPSLPNNLASIQSSSPCISPYSSPLKEFKNFYPGNKLQNTSFQDISENFPLSTNKAFSDFNSDLNELEDIKDLDGLDFNLKCHNMTQSFEENYEPHSKNSITMVSFNEYSNAKQTKLPSQASSDSLPNLNHSLDSINWNLNDNLHVINNFITSSNDGLNKIIVENIDLDIPSKMSSNKNDIPEEFILISDSEPSEFSDSQLIPSSDSHRFHKIEEIQTIHLNKPLPSKRQTEPVKCKPFDDSITHENYNLFYYSSEQCLEENSQSENMQTNTDNDSSNNCSLTLSQESVCLAKEQVYDTVNLETKFSMNRNIDLNQIDTERNERDLNFIQENQGILNNSLQKIDSMQLVTRNIDLKNVNSNQNDIQKNQRDWNFFKRNQGVITDFLQKIDSRQFLDANQNSTILFSEREFLPTSYSFYENDTSLRDIGDYDCLEDIDDSEKYANSLFEQPIVLSQLEDSCNEPKRQGTKDEQLKQWYNEPDINILEQIHNENQLAQFELDVLQNRNQEFSYDNSVDLVTSVSEFPHPSSAHLNSASSSQFNHVAQPFRPSWLSQQSLKMQSQCPSVTATDSSLSERSNDQPEILSNLLYSLQNPKICKSPKKTSVGNLERTFQIIEVSKYEELKFPSRQDVIGNMIPKRKMVIPVTFQNLTEYKKVLTAVLKEHLNIILFELSSSYHNAMAKVDLSSYQQPEQNSSISDKYPQAVGSVNQHPNCNCGMPSKMIQVRKEGRNKGRFFYTCTAAQSYRCKFFQWEDQYDQQSARMPSSSLTPLKSQSPKLCNANGINMYLRRHHIMFYCETLFVRQSPWERKSKRYQQYECKTQKDRLYIRLSFKEPSGCYSKDDLWIISKSLNLEASVTFIARSVFYGPNSSSELQIEPLAGYSPSNWNNETVCHAVLAGNVSTELSCLMNLQEHVTISSAPIISSLLHRKCLTKSWTKTMAGFKTPFQSQKPAKYSSHELANLAEKYITFWKLNSGQATALNNVASMLDSGQSENSPIILIHGVFGSGKSFLLAIIVLYLLDVIETHETMKSSTNNMNDEKILISSTTNVAVDRILLYLLEFGCSEFIRVGSVKKIAKPILPLSVHASVADNHDLKDLQEMMRDENLSKMEKQYVRKSIETHKLGINKKKLHAVKVVGVTCASCSFSCLEKLKFPIVLLDECSQMTEPTSLLPLARFGCEKLLLVGDPLQLDPTIQGSEADNQDGLEQSMFDRLLKMGHESVLLRRQYRCHPAISNISNALFYGKQLKDGIKAEDRPKLVPELPTLCFYDVGEGKENCESTGSFYNTQEADFVISLILALLASEIEPLSIGVIALYKSQTNQISKKMLEAWQKPDNKFLKGKSIKSIQVSTVDAFQGGERDIIILSCVRTSQTGFVNNNKRMNVALSRARNHLFIIGKSSNLCTDETWSQVIRICQDSSNSFQSAKEGKIKLQELWSRAQMAEALEEEEKRVETRTVMLTKRKC